MSKKNKKSAAPLTSLEAFKAKLKEHAFANLTNAKRSAGKRFVEGSNDKKLAVAAAERHFNAK